MADNGAVIAANHDVKRSSKWRATRKAHLKANPYCIACKAPSGWKRLMLKGKALIGLKPVQVHHRIPFHSCVVLGRPDLENDDRNLITLCESGDNHHLLIGHLGDFASYNPEVETHAKHKFHAKTAVDIKADEAWKKLHEMNPKDVDKLNDLEKSVLRGYIDKIYPKLS